MTLKIKEVRAQKGMSRAALAQAVGVTWAAVEKWERGAAMPDLAHFVQIAAALGCPMERLIGKDEEKRKEADTCQG